MTLPSPGGPRRPGRRHTLALLGAGVGSSLVGACAPPAPPDRRVRLALADLSPGGRVQVDYDGTPVELVRTDSGVVARSLMCTHFGCRVRWHEEVARYLCACHGGVFDGAGRPVGGPPTRPLALVPVEVAGDEVLVGEP
jgi:nitrite reductase/ring-hydroxylating ferredoxin subunit